MKVVITGSAGDDIIAGYGFYESQGYGVGAYFRDAIFAEIDSLRTQAGIHPKVYGQHRLLTKSFPYAVFYQVSDDVALVLAVLDCRRDPAWIRRRLKSR